jgi:hypothetical protein
VLSTNDRAKYASDIVGAVLCSSWYIVDGIICVSRQANNELYEALPTREIYHVAASSRLLEVVGRSLTSQTNYTSRHLSPLINVSYFAIYLVNRGKNSTMQLLLYLNYSASI